MRIPITDRGRPMSQRHGSPPQAQLTYEGYEVPNSGTPKACLRYLLSFARQVRDRQKKGRKLYVNTSREVSLPPTKALSFVCFVTGRMELIVYYGCVKNPKSTPDGRQWGLSRATMKAGKHASLEFYCIRRCVYV